MFINKKRPGISVFFVRHNAKPGLKGIVSRDLVAQFVVSFIVHSIIDTMESNVCHKIVVLQFKVHKSCRMPHLITGIGWVQSNSAAGTVPVDHWGP